MERVKPKMRILILGGSGSASGAIVSSLATSENELAVFDLYPEKVIFPSIFESGTASFLDVRDANKLDELVCGSSPIFQTYDALVYNVAATTESLATGDLLSKCSKLSMVSDFDPQIWQLMFDVNVNPVFRIISKMHNYIERVGDVNQPLRLNKMIVTSSIYGSAIPDFNLYKNSKFVSYPGYGASKASLEYLVRWSASFFGKYGLKINAVSLGGIFNEHDEVFERTYGSRVCLNRMGRTTDIQGIYPFLLSPQSDFITGQVIRVDGGYLP